MKQHRTGLLAEFRQFIARGNVTELAVGVIIGGAFQSIVNSLTADIIMPVVGIFVSESTFSNLSLSIGSAVIQYGNFIQAILNFLITALALFSFIKVVNRLHRKKEAAPQPAPPAPSGEELLLTEIRDLLRDR